MAMKNQHPNNWLIIVFLFLTTLMSSINVIIKIRKKNDKGSITKVTEQRISKMLFSIYNNQGIDLQIQDLRNSKWETLESSEKLFDGNSLLLGFWLPEELCELCYYHEIELLREFVNNIGSDKSLIITNTQNPRQMQTFLENNRGFAEIYTLNSKENKLNELAVPGVFLLNEEMSILFFMEILPGAAMYFSSYLIFAKSLINPT